MPQVNIGGGGVTTFKQLYDQLTPKQLGSSQHIRSDAPGQVLYNHTATFSGIGKAAADARAQKWQGGADQVKQLVANQYGQDLADRVFANLGQQKGTRNIDTEVRWKDLGRISAEIDRQAALGGSQGSAKPAFGTAVQDSINDKFGPGGDLSDGSKFKDGVHFQFTADADRATYKIGDQVLPKDVGTVTDTFRKALSADEFKALTAVLHQGASLAVIEQLAFSDDGFVKGQIGVAKSEIQQKSSVYSLTGRGEDGALKVTIEDSAPVGSLARFDEHGNPQYRHLDPDASSLRTTIHGEVRPGKDPLFVITQPIAYELRMKDGDPG